MNAADVHRDPAPRARLAVDRRYDEEWGPFVIATHLLIETPRGTRRIALTLPEIEDEPDDA